MPPVPGTLEGHLAGDIAAVLDLELFAGLRELAVATGQPAFLRDLVNQFLVQIPALLAQLRGSAQRGDMTAVWNAAHGLKGSSGTLGATSPRPRVCGGRGRGPHRAGRRRTARPPVVGARPAATALRAQSV